MGTFPGEDFFITFSKKRRRMKRITLKDLSEFLSLSTSTVSRALLNDKNISPATREKVLEAAEKMGYRPNAAALNLKYRKSGNIGFVVPEMITPFSSKVLQGIQEILYPLGYQVIITQSDEDPVLERKNLNVLEQFNVDGIILDPCHETYNEEVYTKIMERGTPMVFFDRIPGKSTHASKVVVNDYISSSLVVEHLISTGRKRIAHIRGPETIRNAGERAGGYERILKKYRLSDRDLTVQTTGMSFADGKNAVKMLLEKRIPFDGIFAFSDTLAIGAMNHLLSLGIKIPDEVSIASFSGTELATIVHPQLTTVEQPLIKMGNTAAELILEKINDASSAIRTVVLDSRLIYRDSTVTGH